jgi:hypothetical protein
MSEMRASQLEVGNTYREYGFDEEEAVTITEIGYHGDAVLITGSNEHGDVETTLDGDEVVEILSLTPTAIPVPARPVMPDLQMDVTGTYIGNPFPEQEDYRILLQPYLHEFALTVESTSGTVLGDMTITKELADGIIGMAGIDHGLDGYQDDWVLPTGLDRVMTWTIPAGSDNWIRLDEAQIDEIADWLRCATGEVEYTGDPERWEY